MRGRRVASRGTGRNRGWRQEVVGGRLKGCGRKGVAAFVRSGQVGVGPTVVLQTIDTAHYTACAQYQSWHRGWVAAGYVSSAVKFTSAASSKPPQGFALTPTWHCVMPKRPVPSTGLRGGEQQKRGPSVGVWGSATGVGWLRTLWKCTSYRRSHPSPDPHACEQEIKENCLRSDISCDVQLSSGILASRHVWFGIVSEFTNTRPAAAPVREGAVSDSVEWAENAGGGGGREDNARPQLHPPRGPNESPPLQWGGATGPCPQKPIQGTQTDESGFKLLQQD